MGQANGQGEDSNLTWFVSMNCLPLPPQHTGQCGSYELRVGVARGYQTG